MHIGVVVLSLMLSLVPVVSTLASGGYVISVFPSFLTYCNPRNSAVFFYSFVLILCIVLPTGSTFNLLTLWNVLRVRKHTLKQVGISACMISVNIFKRTPLKQVHAP